MDVSAAKRAYLTSAAAYEVPVATSALVVDAVYTASILGAQGQAILTTGTITQDGNGQLSYSSSPSDRLRVVYSAGATVEYFISQIDGNFALDSSAFLTEDHALNFRYVNSGVADLQVVASRSGSTQQGSMNGTLVIESVSHTVSCSRQGTVTSQVDSGFARTDSNETVTGTITAADFSMTVNEQRVSAFQVYNGQSVNDISRTIDDAWTTQGIPYTLSGGLIQKSFVDGVAAQLDSYWRAEGPLTRDGVPVGGLGWGQDGLAIQVWLDVGGQRTVLETYSAPQS
ncbi:MAG: hypothetical protein AB2A00_02105 [Myxococcota bacterium]